MRTVILSAHLDDAVFSATTQLLRPQAQVVTVFAGPPMGTSGRTRWDGTTGARSSAERHRDRLAEDDRAVAGLGCASLRLCEPEIQYRDKPVDLDLLAGKLMTVVKEAAEVWLPAGIGQHPDHVAAREAGLRAVRAASPVAVVLLYADLPYTVEYGWPSWATGEPKPPFLDPDVWLEHELVRAGLSPQVLTAKIFELDPRVRRYKEDAMLCYRTQLPGLHLTPEDRHRWEACLRYELAWEMLSPEPQAN
jgi:LmbE family N-acetylglucosaminyl deacetylase